MNGGRLPALFQKMSVVFDVFDNRPVHRDAVPTHELHTDRVALPTGTLELPERASSLGKAIVDHLMQVLGRQMRSEEEKKQKF
jgi:hypothetical protein